MGLRDWSDEQLFKLRQVFVNAGVVEPYELGDYANTKEEMAERLETQLEAWGQDIEELPSVLIPKVEDLFSPIANATLDIVRGLGGAIIDGLDGAYDAARAKLSGKEADVVAGLVVATLSIMTAVYLYHSAKYARDAF